MKRVKECPSCGLYNDRSNDFCDGCGAALDDIIISVDDSLTRDPNFQNKKDAIEKDIRVSEEKEKENETQKEDTIVCPECGCINSASSEVCSECGTILHSDRDINLQEKAKIDSTYAPVEQKVVVKVSSGISKMELTSSYGSGKLILKEEKQVFGRENFTSPFLRDYLKISRNHFEYCIKDGHVFLTDCSTNGTSINGIKLVKNIPSEIHNLDKLTLADFSFDVTLC